MATQDDSDLDGELHSKFLMAAADITRTQPTALRCHLDLLRAAILNKYNYGLSTVGKKKTTACPYCLTSWKCGDFILRMRPKAKLGKKMKKILEKEKNNQVLSPIQKKLAQLHRGNTVIITCRVCEKQTRLKTFKKPHVPKATEINGKSVVIDNPLRMKKRKNKSKSCGLNPEVILKLNPLCKIKEYNVVNGQENGVGPIDFSMKRGDKNLPDILEGGTGKPTEHEQRKSTQVNPLPKVSLGAGKASKRKNMRSFDPFDHCFDSPKSGRNKNQGKVAMTRSGNKKTSGRRYKKLLNPYSNEAINQAIKTGKKKVDRWKKLVAAEEATPTNSTSLRDYCREYFDVARFQAQDGVLQMQPKAAHQPPRKGYIEPVQYYQYYPTFPVRFLNVPQNNPNPTFAHKSLY